MSNINPAYKDRVRYTLSHPAHPALVISEPDGWREDDKEFARNKEYHGIFAQLSNNLTFAGEAADYINLVRSTNGINAAIKLVKDVMDDEERWVREYTGFLDLSTWGVKSNGVQVKFNAAGLEKTLKARRTDKVEFERSDSLTGKSIDPLKIDKLFLAGRRIYLVTDFNVLTGANELKLKVETNAGNTRAQTGGYPLNVFSKSHDQAHSVIPQATATESAGTTGMMFYANNDRERLLKINLNLELDVFFQQYENVQWCFYGVCFTTYQNGVNYDFKKRFFLHELRSPRIGAFNFGASQGLVSQGNLPQDKDYAYPSFTKNIKIENWNTEITLLENESLAIELYLKSDMYVDNNAGVRAYAKNMKGTLTMEEDSAFPSSVVNGVLGYELFERSVEIMTGSKSNFKSDFLGRTELGYPVNGPGALSMVSHGHWIRGFEKGDDLYKPFTTSMKDLFDAYAAAYLVGLGIEKIGYKEKIIIEDLKYFYNMNVTIRLGEFDAEGKFNYIQVSNLERNCASEYYYSSVKIGSQKGGDYEEIMGLEETNTASNFVTFIEGVINTYNQESPFNHDTYGEEIIRRRPKSLFPTTDQTGDRYIWLHDVKAGLTGIYEPKSWQDVLVVEPLGLFSPETAYNFIYSPVSMFLKHGWWLNAGLREYPNEVTKFGSSRGKSSITQHLIGGNALAENGNIPTNQLQKARFVPEEITFDYAVNSELLRAIEGYSTILNKKVPNVYGLIEFKNEKGEIERGFLLSLKPNKEGKWKLLKASR